MRILIVGAGRVGIRTARVLHEEGHHLVLIENDPDKAERARALGIETIEGDGSRDKVLQSANLEAMDAVAALTGDLNVNYAVCSAGKFHDCRTVMRIDDDYREDIYREYAELVDEVIYPERLGAAGAKTALLGGDFNVVADLAEQLQVLTVNISEHSPVIGKRVSTISLPGGARIYAHGKVSEPMRIPLPGTEISAGDRVAVIAEQDTISSVTEQLVGTPSHG